MENASKALMIAGGVLLAVLILSVLIYVYSHIQSVERSKAEVLKAEELSKFNREFESYNKNSMYGTDIISVINKAILYNDKYGNMININLITLTNFQTTVIEWITNDKGKNEQKSNYTTTVLEENQNFDLNSSVLKSFISSDDKKKTEYSYDSNGNRITTETVPAIYEFKKAKFQCTEVKYDSNSGRVSSMSFKQVQI